MVDVGLIYKGFHTDNAFTKALPPVNKETDIFLQAGKQALGEALAKVRPGNKIGLLSQAIESVLNNFGYNPARGLTGHGVGKKLHLEPTIPCHLSQPLESTYTMRLGDTYAIEVIYMQGSPELELASDGWTISTKDGKLAAVFEETVEVATDGPSILTTPALFQRS
jgi:methionyl aminopeptidase